MKVAVVTPTIGNEHLVDCIESVKKQTYKDLVHYVFVDGQQYDSKVDDVLFVHNHDNLKTICLQENVGKGWYGHRVYAACSFLVNADIVCYLDEDNWFEPNHVESLVNVINQGNDWAYSFRKIYSKNGDYLCEDNCESLGKWPVYFNDEVHHIDTSSFAVKRDVAVKIGHAWYGQWGADRQFFYNLARHFPKFDSNLQHTMCYRLDGNPNSVSKNFFDEGNKINLQNYNGEFPWKLKQLSSQAHQVI